MDPKLAYGAAGVTCWLLAAALWACNADPTAEAGQLYSHEARRFRVTVNRPESAHDVLRVEIAPRAPWKLAEEFPCRLDLRGPELRLEPVAFSEESAAFEIPRQDRTRLAGSLAFAVCQGEVCIPVDHPFETALPSRH